MASGDEGYYTARSSLARGSADPFKDFNTILSNLGPSQMWSCFLILLSGITCSWETLSFVFLAIDVPYRCIEPNITACSDACPEVEATVPKSTSILSEWNLFCTDAYKRQLSQSILIVGIMCGSILFGHLADQLGRRPTFLGASVLVLATGILVGVSPWYWFFCLTRFFLGLSCGGLTIICIVFLVEYVDVDRRELMVIMYRIPYTIGHSTLPALAFFINNWRYLQIGTTLFAVVYVVYFWLIPESPRWLLITGQVERCIGVLRSGIKRDAMSPEAIRTIIQKAHMELRSSNYTKRATMIDLFKSPNLCKKTCILGFAWFSLYFEFYGVSEYLALLSGNTYINYGVGAWLTIPATLLAYPVVRNVTRRAALLTCYGVSGLCLLSIPFLSEKVSHVWILGLSTVVVVMTSISYCNMHLFSTETFPTILRNSGMGFSICVGRLGSMISPYISDLAAIRLWIPALIFGVPAVISAFILLFLPETKGEILPETIEDGEYIGKDRGSRGIFKFNDSSTE